MIATSAPLADVLDRLTRLIESQLDGVCASILLLDETGLRLYHGAAPNLPVAYTQAVDGLRVGPSAGSCGTAAFIRQSVIVADVSNDPRWVEYRALAAAHGLRSCWSAPILSHQGQVLGTFALYSASAREPSPAEYRLIDAATKIAGIAIERKLAEDRIQFMATHDALTGLPNRALLTERLTRAIQLAQQHDRWATVAFVDLDNFKYVNDSLGHNAGDELLKSIAGRMAAALRATNSVVRIGGDEFVVVFSDQAKDVESVVATVHKLRSAIAEPIEINGRWLSVTSSVGAATYPSDGQDADALADQRRHRDVSGERGRPRQFPVLSAGIQRQGSREISVAGRVARGGGPRRVRSLLSAAGQPAHARHLRRRGAHPLEPPDPRAASSVALHPAGRGDRTDRADRRMGAQGGLPPGARLAEPGPAAAPDERQRLRPAIQGPATDRHRRQRAQRERPRGEIPRARTHGEPDHAGRRAGGRDDGGAGAARRAAVDRRLRHGLLESERAQDLSRSAAEDRQRPSSRGCPTTRTTRRWRRR